MQKPEMRTPVSTVQDVKEYPVGFDQELCAGFYKKLLLVQSMSEIGTTVIVEELWPSGRMIEIGLNILRDHGIPTLKATVVSSQATGDKFVLKLSFVDMDQEMTEKVRLVCRELQELNRK